MLNNSKITAPATPTTYIIHLTSASSSKADVMITAVRTYFEMSIRKSETFSQIEILFTVTFPIAKIIKLLLFPKLGYESGKSVVLV